MGGKPEGPREPRSHMWPDKNGQWHSFVLVGRKANGEADRRHREAESREALIRKVLDLEDLIDANNVPKPGRSKTFEAWLEYWLGTVAPLQVRHMTLQSYRSHAKNYLIPRLGRWKLSELSKRHFAQMYMDLQIEDQIEASTIHSIHRAASTALSKAIDLEEPGIHSNPAAAARKSLPEINSEEVIPLDAKEVAKIIGAVADTRNHARWWLAFLGPRQGEVLGMKWSDVDWDTGIIHIRRQLQRHVYQHGCENPVSCAKPRCSKADGCDLSCERRRWEHGCSDPRSCASRQCGRARKNPCPPDCCGHARSCPERRKGPCRTQSHRTACPEDCTGHARYCPLRRGGLVLTETKHANPDKAKKRKRHRKSERELRPKSAAGMRRMPLPAIVRDELRVHQARQEMERAEAGSMWQDTGLIFTTPLGAAVDPSRDWEEWGEVLDEAGVEYIHLHGARHSAATFLGSLGVDPVIRMAMLGWASPEMAKRYQHVSDLDLMAAADRLGDAAFRGLATGAATGTERSV
jgi:integrase